MAEDLTLVTEEAGIKATIEQLIADENYDEALEMVNTIRGNHNEIAREMQEESRKIEAIMEEIARKARIDRKWKRFKIREEHLNDNFPQYFETMLEIFRGDISEVIADMKGDGNEVYFCETVEKSWRQWHACGYNTNKAYEFHRHLLRENHTTDAHDFQSSYASMEAVVSHTDKIHRLDGPHGSQKSTIYLIGDQYVTEGVREWKRLSFCGSCYRIQTDNGCDDCHGPTDKKGCVFQCGDNAD